MKRFLPHFVFFASIALIIIIGVATNSRDIAALAGFFVVFTIDPVVIAGGLLAGFLAKSQLKIVALALSIGIAISIIIATINSSKFSFLICFLRFLSVLSWAYAANLITLLRKRGNTTENQSKGSLP